MRTGRCGLVEQSKGAHARKEHRRRIELSMLREGRAGAAAAALLGFLMLACLESAAVLGQGDVDVPMMTAPLWEPLPARTIPADEWPPRAPKAPSVAQLATVQVDSATSLAAALRDDSVASVALVADVELSEAELGVLPIELWRNVTITSKGSASDGASLLRTLSSSLPRETEWLRLQDGTLAFHKLRLGPGMLELGHDDGHMPLTLLGASLYGHGFDRSDPSGTYCGCTGLSFHNSIADAAFAPHREADLEGSTPRQILEKAIEHQRTWALSLGMQSVFTTSRWGFLDLKETVYPAMRFRLRNTTLVFPPGASEEAPGEEGELPLQDSCNTVTVPGARGRDYNGGHNVTASGSPCMPWASVRMSGLDFSAVEGNACRNPGDLSAVWCFIRPGERLLPTQPDFPYQWDYCDVPSCAVTDGTATTECANAEDNGASYAGNVSVAHHGIACEDWTASYPALYGNLPHRSCRNPSGEMGFVGCMVGSKYTKCDIEPCNGGLELEPPGVQTTDIVVAAVSSAIVLFLCMGLALFSVRHRGQRGHSVYHLRAGDSVKESRSSSEAHTPSRAPGSEDNRPLPVRSRNSMSRTNSVPRHGQIVSDSGTDATGSTVKSLDERVKSELEEDTLVLSTPVDMGLLDLKKCLGAGSFGKVWQGRWLGADVAVKVMILSGRQARLKVHLLKGLEANFLRAITHPNIVQTYHIYKVMDRSMGARGSNGGDEEELEALRDAGIMTPICEIWIVQELCNKGDLKRNSHLVFPAGKGSLQILLWTLKEIILAISYLHHNDIVHGDLKRENVLLKSSTSPHGFTAKVADFGLARNLQGLDAYYANSMSGDMKYLAPETLEHQKISSKMDIYSFGFLIWELATGKAVGADNVTLAMHVQQVVKERKRPDFPDFVHSDLADLARACWEHDMDKRPCALLVAKRLDHLIDQHCPTAYNNGSFKDGLSWRDMTGPLGSLMSKGPAPEDASGYVMMPPLENAGSNGVGGSASPSSGAFGSPGVAFAIPPVTPHLRSGLPMLLKTTSPTPGSPLSKSSRDLEGPAQAAREVILDGGVTPKASEIAVELFPSGFSAPGSPSLISHDLPPSHDLTPSAHVQLLEQHSVNLKAAAGAETVVVADQDSAV